MAFPEKQKKWGPRPVEAVESLESSLSSNIITQDLKNPALTLSFVLW
jgi:hypothetical protein